MADDFRMSEDGGSKVYTKQGKHGVQNAVMVLLDQAVSNYSMLCNRFYNHGFHASFMSSYCMLYQTAYSG